MALKRAFSLPAGPEPAVPPTEPVRGISSPWQAALSSLQSLEDTPGALYLQQRRCLPLEVALAARVKFSADWPGSEYYRQRELAQRELERSKLKQSKLDPRPLEQRESDSQQGVKEVEEQAGRESFVAENGATEQGRGVGSFKEFAFNSRHLPRPVVVFPIYDDQGNLVAAQGRYLEPEQSKLGRAKPSLAKMLTVGDKKRGLFFTAGFCRAGTPTKSPPYVP